MYNTHNVVYIHIHIHAACSKFVYVIHTTTLHYILYLTLYYTMYCIVYCYTGSSEYHHTISISVFPKPVDAPQYPRYIVIYFILYYLFCMLYVCMSDSSIN